MTISALSAPAASTIRRSPQLPTVLREDSFERSPAGPASLLHPGSVAYGVIPPLFGGEKPLQAVTAKLDELVRMGVDALWLSPIQETDDPGQISYGTTDFQRIRQDFGKPEDLKKLVKEAHKRGLKVLLDIAPNHVSIEHPFCQHAIDHGTDSPYYDYFQRDENGQLTSYFDWDHLKNLNYAHPDVQRLITDAFKHWVQEYDIDGFRVDAAWGPKERQPDYWAGLNAELESIKPGIFMLAEASAKDPYYMENGFDAAYDWGHNMGEWAWNKVFDHDRLINHRLHKALTAPSGTPSHQIARFLNNNDTGERFITRYGPEKTRVAATLMLTLPGIPIVYTGDEVGAEFLPYDDPPALDFKSDPHQLRSHYSRLAQLRETCPALAAGEFTPVPVEGSGAAYAFLRHLDGQPPALVVLNFGASKDLKLQLPAEFSELGREGRLEDLLSGQTQLVRSQDGTLKLHTEQGSSLILQPGQPLSWLLAG